jgi:hypothetical protein
MQQQRTLVVCRDIEKGSQRVVDDLVLVAARGHNVVEFCVRACVSRRAVWWGYKIVAPCLPLTIPELLLILEIIRHLKCHVVVAGLFPESSSPATKATKGCADRRKLVVDGQLFASSPTCRRRFIGVS